MRLAFETDEAVLPKIEGSSSEANGFETADIAELLKNGISAAQKGERSRARALLIRATEIDSKNEDAWMWLASISEFPEELLVFLNNVLEINPKNKKAKEWRKSTLSLMARTFVQRGIAAHDAGSYTSARQCFEQALSIDNRCEMAWFWKASVVESTEEKVVCLEKVLRLNPENKDAAESLSAIAAERLEAALAKAKLTAVSGDTAKAEEELFAILMECPNNADAWLLKAFLTNVFDDKLAALEKALEFDPENKVAQTNLAFLAEIARTAKETLSSQPLNENEVAPEIEAAEPPEPQLFTVEQESSVFHEEQKFQSVEPATTFPATEVEQKYSDTVVAEKQDQGDSDGEPVEVADTVNANTDHTVNDRSDSAGQTGQFENLSNEPVDTEPSNFAAVGDTFSHDNAATDELDFQSMVTKAVDQYDSLPELSSNANEESNSRSRSASDMFGETATHDADPDMETVDNLNSMFSNDENTEFVPVTGSDTGVADPKWERQDNAADENLLEVPFSPSFEESDSLSRTESFTNDQNQSEASYESPCPYCSTDNDPQAVECKTCHALLTLADIEALLSASEGDREMIRNGVTEKEALWNSREFTSEEFIELGIGHFNLGNHDFGFKYLQEASRLDSNNVILAGHVNKIAIRLDEMRRQSKARESMPKGKTILVVDDSPTVRKLISGKLEKSGHNVICAVDGVEGLARLEERMPDLVLLDINMPNMDGYQVCKEIRSNPEAKDLPVVMISGKDGFFDKVRGRMAGTTGYITKPFGPETLMKALETYLLPDPVTE